VSGRVHLAMTSGDVNVRSISGTVDVGAEGKAGVFVKTVSGSVRIALPVGIRPQTRLMSLSSRPRSECPEGNDCEIKVKSMSGSIEVVPR
jgi:DUF4097 and DUF4098 domain-containing protein YvlB